MNVAIADNVVLMADNLDDLKVMTQNLLQKPKDVVLEIITKQN